MLIIIIVELVLIVTLLPFTWVRVADPLRRKGLLASAQGNNANLLQNTLLKATPAASDSGHARKCLKFIEARRQTLKVLGVELRGLFGFQEASVANQLEHLESLLVWSITQSLISLERRAIPEAEEEEVVAATAIQMLHNKILARVAQWREKGV